MQPPTRPIINYNAPEKYFKILHAYKIVFLRADGESRSSPSGLHAVSSSMRFQITWLYDDRL
jgi:hypothetical protein